MPDDETLTRIAKDVAAEERKENQHCPAAVAIDVLRERAANGDENAKNTLIALLAERSMSLQVSNAIRRNKR